MSNGIKLNLHLSFFPFSSRFFKQGSSNGSLSRSSTPNQGGGGQVTKVTATAKFKVEVHTPQPSLNSILFFISAMAHGSSLSQHASSQCWQTISSSTSSCNIDLDLWPTPQRLTRDFGRSAEVSKAARSQSDVDFCGFPHVTCRLTYRVFFNWFIKVVSACWSWKKLVSPQYTFIVLGDQFIVIYSIGKTSFFQP